MNASTPPVDSWSPAVYQTNASFVYSSLFSTPVLALLNAQPNERILDLGCGTGQLTVKLQAAVGELGSVVGYDMSRALLDEARMAEGGQRVDWVQGDGMRVGQSLAAVQKFDACFSNAAIHWMKDDPNAVVEGVYSVLNPGGRFVGEFGGYLNMVGVRSTIHQVLRAKGYDPVPLDPWYFPTPRAYRALLEGAGFIVNSCELVPRITPLPTGLEGWLATFATSFLSHLSESERKQVVKEICDICQVDLKSDDGWEVMYVRLRFSAVKGGV